MPQSQESAADTFFRADGAGYFRIYVSIVHDLVILHLPVPRKVSCVYRTLTPCSNGAHPTSQRCAFQAAGGRAVVPLRPSRLQTMSMTFLDETRTCSSPGGSLREHTATQGCTLIPTFLDGSHTVRAVEGGPCVPPLPPQVPRMAEIDVSVATATFLLCFESLEVRGPPI